MKKALLFVSLISLLVLSFIGCNSNDNEFLPEYDGMLSRASSNLSQEDAFNVGSKYLIFENGQYKLNLPWSDAERYGISREDYNIMSQDIASANIVVSKIRNSKDVDDTIFEIAIADSTTGRDIPIELDSLISFSDTQRVIHKSYGEMFGGGGNLYYINTVVCVPFGHSHISFGIGSSGWFNTYVGGVVNGYTHFGYSTIGSYCSFYITVPGPGIYTIRILVSGYGNVYYNSYTY